MKERPILFSAPMVKAILNGTKTVTRRTVKLPNGCVFGNVYDGQIIDTKHQNMLGHDIEFPIDELHCPYGQVGDQLWVREAWRQAYPKTSYSNGIIYRADAAKALGMDEYSNRHKWKPSIHMPRWASRIQLEITGVRVERLNDISGDDAIAEGSFFGSCQCWPKPKTPIESAMRQTWCRKHGYEFKHLWESINGAGSWDLNPWVWVVEFKVIKPWLQYPNNASHAGKNHPLNALEINGIAKPVKPTVKTLLKR